MIYLLFALPLLAAGFFALRCHLIKHALKETRRELLEIQKDLSQNQILHLAAPDQDLEKLLHAVNYMLEELRRERLNYEKREKEFQRQIEQISHDLRTPLTVIVQKGFPKNPADIRLLKFYRIIVGGQAGEIIELRYQMFHGMGFPFYDFQHFSGFGRICLF